VGVGSGTQKDQGTARAEIWVPVWDKPATFREIRCLLREGRASLDGRPAKNGLEFAEAVASLGVDRGIQRFVRYSLFKRRGDSYVATPVGEMEVKYRSSADLVRGLNTFVELGDRAARDAVNADGPNSWPPLKRAVEEAQYRALLREGEGGMALVDLAAALGRMHRWLLEHGRMELLKGKLPGEWIGACGFLPEARIAAALASLRHPDAGSLAMNLMRSSREFSWSGIGLSNKLLATLQRRMLAAGDSDRSPLQSGFVVFQEDVAAFLDGGTDDELIEALIHAFVLVREWPAASKPEKQDQRTNWPVYALLKTLFLPKGIPGTDGELVRLRHESRIPGLLKAGRVQEAAEMAERRCRIAGLSPVSAKGMSAPDAVRLGGALLIPVVFTELGGAAIAPRLQVTEGRN